MTWAVTVLYNRDINRVLKSFFFESHYGVQPVADPGFPWRRGEGEAKPSGGTSNLFDKIFAENCIKMKEIGPRGVGACLPCAPWIRQRATQLNSH